MRNMGIAVDEAKEMPTAFGGRRTSDNIGSLQANSTLLTGNPRTKQVSHPETTRTSQQPHFYAHEYVPVQEVLLHLVEKESIAINFKNFRHI